MPDLGRFLNLLQRLEKDLGNRLIVRERLSAESLTTFGVGGTVRRLLEPADSHAAAAVMRELHAESYESRLLGAGSNLVLPDGELRWPVIRLGRKFQAVHPAPEGVFDARGLDELLGHPAAKLASDTLNVLAFGGCGLMGLSRKLSSLGLAGLEFAAGIPGSIGGAVRMNAGAHGHSMQEIVERAYVLAPGGEFRVVDRNGLGFRYRHCELEAGALVLAAELRLAPDDPQRILERRQQCLEYRKQTQPLQLPSAGSVFRNPESADGAAQAAGWLLDQAGYKGRRWGAVEFSDLHANWLVRTAPAGLAKDARFLVDSARSAVEAKFGIDLEPEIIFW